MTLTSREPASASALSGGRFPFPAYPEGWFQVAYSHEIGVGDVASLHYFGRQLVAYRGEDGQVRVLDAYCPHQGADIGVGGKVVGDCVMCPFHGWLFDEHGHNVEIPYADGVNRGARLGVWPTEERAGIVFVWHSATGAAPTWQLPSISEFEDDRFLWHVPDNARWTIRTHVQEIFENTVDVAHFATVHGVSAFGAIDVESEGPRFRAVAEVHFVTPRGAVKGAVDSELWGLGIDVVRHVGLGESCTLLTATPIDGERVDARYTFMVQRDSETGGATRMGMGFVRDFIKQITQDIPIWEHKIYRARPQLARGEGAVITFRDWASTIYPQ